MAATVLPLAAASGWVAWEQYRAQREALGHTLISVARAISAAAERELYTGRTIVETLASSSLLDERRFADLYGLAVKSLATRPGTWIVLFEPSGQIVFNTVRPYGTPMPNVFEQEARLPPPQPGEMPRGGAATVRKVFETGAPVYSDLFAGQVSGSYVVAVSVPVVRDGRTLYCLTIAIPARLFQPLVEAQPRLGGSGAVLFDNHGFIIARAVRPEEFVGRRVPAESLAAVRAAPEDFGRGTSVQGERIYRAVARSAVTGWSAGVSLSEEAAFGAMASSMRRSALFAALILAAGFGLAALMARTLARRQAAEAQNLAKDQFIAALSHELRNPIAAIALGADLLRRMVRRDRQAGEVVETVSRQVTQLRRLLDDLLDNSRAMYGKLTLELRSVDLQACAAQIARDYVRRPAFPARIDVVGAPVWVRADPARLSQMIDNLVENAVKYGARTVKMHVSAEAANGVLAVVDDGQGISRELMQRLFQPFVQGEQPLERPQGGLGLGLALVKRIVGLHGGSIEVRSEGAGKGSTFVLRLPLAGEIPQATPSPARPAARSRRRVLIVEDMEDARESLRQLLELDGHEVALAADGPQALLKLRSFRPDVALVDIGLPGMNGYDVAREARSIAGGGVVLVALTGYGQEADRRAALQAGFDAHLTKPVSLADLDRALGSG